MSKKAIVLFLFILICGIFLRAYNFSNTVEIGADQALAFIIADRIINSNHVLLLGPVTSLYNVNILPPTYYYLVTFLYYFLRDEVTVTFAYSLFSIFSIILIFLLAKELLDIKSGLLASTLFAFSFEMIKYNRRIWEPHSIPFFISLSFYLLFLAKSKNQTHFIYLSIFFFFTSLMYISSYLVLPIYFILTIFIYISLSHHKNIALLKIIFTFLFFFIIFYAPVLAFEYTHNFPSWNILQNIFLGKSSYFNYNFSKFLISVLAHSYLFINSTFLLENFHKKIYIALVILLIIIIFSSLKECRNKNFTLFVLFPFVTGITLTGLYQEKTYVHRLASLYPFFFIFVSHSIIVFYKFFFSQKFLYKTTIIFPIIMLSIFFQNNILSTKYFIQQRYPVWSHQLRMADYINRHSKNIPFSIYVILPFEKENYYSVEYWYALEKIRKNRLVDLDERGNFIKNRVDKKNSYIFLICRDFENLQHIYKDCLEYFVRKKNLKSPIRHEKIGPAVIFSFES